MILRVAVIQPVYNSRKNDLPKTKDELTKKNTTSFVSVLDKLLKSQPK